MTPLRDDKHESGVQKEHKKQKKKKRRLKI